MRRGFWKKLYSHRKMGSRKTDSVIFRVDKFFSSAIIVKRLGKSYIFNTWTRRVGCERLQREMHLLEAS